jgi:hypothetical protein
MSYKQIYDVIRKQAMQNAILRVDDNAFIPFDPANRDAQAFAKWLKDGGTPESAEEGGTVTAEWIAETIAKLLPNG